MPTFRLRAAKHQEHRKEGERKGRRSDLAKEWEDNLTQVAAGYLFFFAVFWEEICLASYLSSDVGSLICLLLFSLLLPKPAVSVDCPWSLREEAG